MVQSGKQLVCSASFMDWELLKGHICGLHVGQWIIDQGWDNNKHCKFCGKTCINKSCLKSQIIQFLQHFRIYHFF